MLKTKDTQMSFYDADSLCSRLIPEDSFYRKFRDIVSPLIHDENFSDMYVLDNGRPAIPPSLLAMATILQFYRNLSDRDMERACMYDIEIKYALGLRIDDRPFDHSSLGDFRKRLLEHGKEKEVFDNILNKLVESGLIKRNEIQRIDATHIIADVGIPTVITLVRKGIYEILKTLKKRYKDTYGTVTPIDEDARCGAKSPTKKFVGYKTNVSEETGNRFITNITLMRGNRLDGETMVETIREQSEHGVILEKVIGDTAYGDGSYRKELKKDGITMVASLRTINTERVRDIFPKSMFIYDKETHLLTCPEGVTTKASWYDYQKDIRTYYFPMTVCGVCSCKELCTNSKDNRRTIGISSVQEELIEAERYNETEAYKEDMKLRPPIEGKLSELTRYHGLRRARYRGLGKVRLQCYFTAAAVNIKRWIRIFFQRVKPLPMEVVAACA